MIKAVCADCGHVWWANVVMGENRCPKCNSENTCVAISVGDQVRMVEEDE